MTGKQKNVYIQENKNTYHIVYSSDEYDRSQIDSFVYRKSYMRITHYEWTIAMKELNNYKLNEMIVHKDSVHNTRIHNF